MGNRVIDAAARMIGLIELAIGLVTLFVVVAFDIFGIVDKPAGTFVFVVASAVISMALGWGILRRMDRPRVLLIFFSGYVIALKILVYLGVVRFTGDIIRVSPMARDAASLLYHAAVIIFLMNGSVAERFTERNG